MLWVAIAEAVVLVVVVSVLGRLLASQQRAHARREDLLLNQLLHAVGRDWQPAPADESEAQARIAELEQQLAETSRKRVRFIPSPEQHVIA